MHEFSFELKLTHMPVMGYVISRNTPVSFGEGARSRLERVGSCFIQGAFI